MDSPLKFDFHAYNDHVWVSGVGDSGKTKLVQYVLIPFFLRNNLTVAVYDYNNNYDRVGVPVTSKFEIVARFLQNRKSIVYQPTENTQEEFLKFCIVVRHFQNIIIIFEEIQEFLRSKLSMPPQVSAIVKTGRNWKRTYVCVTQRPQEVPTSLMANAKHRFYFPVDSDSKSDRTWLREAIGDMADTLMQAKPYSWVYKQRNGKAELRPPIRPVWQSTK